MRSCCNRLVSGLLALVGMFTVHFAAGDTASRYSTLLNNSPFISPDYLALKARQAKKPPPPVPVQPRTMLTGKVQLRGIYQVGETVYFTFNDTTVTEGNQTVTLTLNQAGPNFKVIQHLKDEKAVKVQHGTTVEIFRMEETKFAGNLQLPAAASKALAQQKGAANPRVRRVPTRTAPKLPIRRPTPSRSNATTNNDRAGNVARQAANLRGQLANPTNPSSGNGNNTNGGTQGTTQGGTQGNQTAGQRQATNNAPRRRRF